MFVCVLVTENGQITSKDSNNLRSKMSNAARVKGTVIKTLYMVQRRVK